MKKYFLLLPLFASAAFVACEDNESTCIPPIYEGFRLSPSASVAPGDSLFVTCVQKVKGNYLNATDYNWTITLQVEKDGVITDSTLVYKYHTNYGGLDNSDPVGRFRIPEQAQSGTYYCNFTAKFNNSADGKGGQYQAETAEDCTGNITSYSYTLYSNANGSCHFRVK